MAISAGLRAEDAREAGSAAAIREYHEAIRMVRDGRNADAFEALRRANRCDPSFGAPYSKAIWVAEKLNELNKAEAHFRDLLSRPDSAPYGRYALALLAIHRGELESGESELVKSIEAAPGFALAYNRFVAVSLQRGRADAAKAYLESRIASDPGNGVLQYAIGYLLQQQRDFARSLEHLTAADAATGGRWEVLDAMYWHYYLNYRFPEALVVLDRMLSKTEGAGHLEWKSLVLRRIGMIRLDLGDYPDAIRRFLEAVAIARDLGDKAGERSFRSPLSLAYFRLGKNQEALEEARSTLALVREAGDKLGEGRQLGLIAEIKAGMGKYPESIQDYIEAIELAGQVRDQSAEADHLAGLAQVYAAVGYDGRALGNLEAAIAAARSIGNPWLEGRFLEILGQVHLKSERYREALKTYDSALALARRIGDRFGEASRLAASAEARTRLGELSVALPRCEQGMRIAEEIGAASLLADMHTCLGGLNLRLGRAGRASEHYQRALAAGSGAHMPEVVWKAHAGLGRVAERQGSLDAARSAYRTAVEEIEGVRANLGIAEEKAGYFEGKVDVYRRLVALLVRMHAKRPADGFDAEAFHFVERARARSSLDRLSEARLSAGGAVEPGLAERQRATEKQFSRLQGELIKQYSAARPDQSKIRALLAAIEQADEEHRAVRREIREKSPAYADLRAPEPIGLGELKQALDPKAVLLEYMIGPDASYLFVVTRDQHRILPLPGAAALGARVNRLREAISVQAGRATLPAYWMEAQALYRELIAPAAGLLAGRGELIIVPDGVLHYLPFGTLLSPTPGAAPEIDPVRLPYLSRSHAVSYAPSATILATVRQQRQNRTAPEKMFAAFADPLYEQAPRSSGDARRSLSAASVRGAQRLENSRREVENIARLYPSGSTALFLAERANETNVKDHGLDRYGVLHFAAHGILDEANPQFSGLLLSRPPDGQTTGDEDGLLQVYEIYNLKLNADLVVLSACQTALGKAVKGEGLVGLTQAFLHAGAASVMASLWKVEDRSAAELMIRFHRHLTGGRSSAQALRQAQLDLIGSTGFAHPYYWAAYSLAGDSRHMRSQSPLSAASSPRSRNR